ncbi:MAG TPA: hypothetical protein VJB82_03660 [Candidatus Peribacterales bacterium]|nr:hypothetical protein [Candidatus Peribacterales bacterium]
MNFRLILMAGAVLVAAQSMTVFADDSTIINSDATLSSPSDTMSSEEFVDDDTSFISDPDTMSEDDMAQGIGRGTCTCVWIRVIKDVEATSKEEAKALAVKIQPVKPGTKSVSCARQGTTSKYTCTVKTTKGFRMDTDQCSNAQKDENTLNGKTDPKVFQDPIKCTYAPDTF